MRLLADENIQQPTVRFLSARVWDVVWAPEAGLAGAADEPLFRYAQQLGRTLLTYNAHFADLRQLAAGRHHGVIRLRYGNQRADAVHPRLAAALESLRDQDLRDTLVTLTDERIRMRKTLPG